MASVKGKLITMQFDSSGRCLKEVTSLNSATINLYCSSGTCMKRYLLGRLHIIFFISLLIFLPAEYLSGTEIFYYDTQNSPIGNDYVLSINIDKKGSYWFGTYITELKGGLTRSDGDSGWTIFDSIDSGYGVSSIVDDSSGIIWLGTLTGGIMKGLNDSTWISYKSDSNLASVNITSLAIDKSNFLWIGTGASGVNRFDVNDGWQEYDISNSGLVSNQILCIFVDNAGNIWFGTYGGISKLDNDSVWSTYTTVNSGLVNNAARCFAEDRFGNIWIGTNEGVSRFDGISGWITYDTNDGLKNNRVNAIAIDSSNNVWFAHSAVGQQGVWLSRFDGSTTWITYNIDHNSGVELTDATSLAVDSVGNVWAGTFGEGVTCLKVGSTGLPTADPAGIPHSFHISQNCPNPFNPSTTIEYSVPRQSHVLISVYDILGRRIKNLADRILPAGNYRTIWDGRDISGNPAPTGIYFCRIRAGNFSESKKMLLIK
jgi:ligand-binding sensor domain-containing protein